MTLNSEIIRDAYRESNLVAINAVPSGSQMEEGLRKLQRLISSVYGNEAGQLLQDIPIGRNNISRPQGFPWYDEVPEFTDWFVPDNSRLVLNMTSPVTVYLNPMPCDGARFSIQDKSDNLSTNTLTVVANGKTLEGLNQIVYDDNGANIEYFFEETLGNWNRINPLEMEGVFPFPNDFEDMFVIGLALRINPSYQVQIDQQSMLAYQRSERNFKARYQQHELVGSESGLYLLPLTVNQRGYYDNTRVGNSAFNSGYAFPAWYRPY